MNGLAGEHATYMQARVGRSIQEKSDGWKGANLKTLRFIKLYNPPPNSIFLIMSIKNLGIEAKFTILGVKLHCIRKVLICLIRQGGR